MTTTEANDLRAAREHAALLRDLEALCAKYAACNRKTSNATDFAHQLTDDPAAAGITYIAGPMTGYADHNYPAFNAMAKRLRDAGLTVINPAEIHPDTKHPWDWYLRRDITELVKCARVVFLNGWSRSRGARLEAEVAQGLGLEMIWPSEVDDFIADRGRRRGCIATIDPSCYGLADARCGNCGHGLFQPGTD